MRSLLVRFTLLFTFVAVATGCVVDDADLAELESELAVTQWQDDVRIPNQNSARQVAMARFNGVIHMVHNGDSSPEELWWTTFNGTSWTPNVKIPNHRSSSEPALVEYGGQLRLLYRRNQESPRGYNMAKLGADGRTWEAASYLPTSTNSIWAVGGPAAVVHDGRLLYAYCARSGTSAGNRDYLYVYDTETRAPYVHFPIGSAAELVDVRFTECENVSLASFNGQLRVLHAAKNVTGAVHEDWYLGEHVGTGTDPAAYTYARKPMSSKTPMSMAICGGVLHMVHGGNANRSEIWWSYLEAGAADWTTNVRVPNQASNGGAALVCATNGQPLMVHNGGTNALWYSRWRP
jgi:hypothetical protein